MSPLNEWIVAQNLRIPLVIMEVQLSTTDLACI